MEFMPSHWGNMGRPKKPFMRSPGITLERNACRGVVHSYRGEVGVAAYLKREELPARILAYPFLHQVPVTQ